MKTTFERKNLRATENRVESYGIEDRANRGRMINRIKTSWLVEFASIAFSFLVTLLVVTVGDIGKERKAKKARTGSPESPSGAEQ
jgi:hypothetical protein